MKTISFIPSYENSRIEEARADANNSLATLQRVVEAHGETLQDAAEYQRLGWDYKINARKADCKKWLDTTKAPEYLYEDSIERAVADLGTVNLDYWKALSRRLVIRMGNSNLSPLINLTTDVVIDNDGMWSVSPEKVKAEKEKFRKTLTPREVEDLEEFRRLLDAFNAFVAKGYTEARNMLLNGNDKKDVESMAEYIYHNYFPGFDNREGKKE